VGCWVFRLRSTLPFEELLTSLKLYQVRIILIPNIYVGKIFLLQLPQLTYRKLLLFNRI